MVKVKDLTNFTFKIEFGGLEATQYTEKTPRRTLDDVWGILTQGVPMKAKADKEKVKYGVNGKKNGGWRIPPRNPLPAEKITAEMMENMKKEINKNYKENRVCYENDENSFVRNFERIIKVNKNRYNAFVEDLRVDKEDNTTSKYVFRGKKYLMKNVMVQGIRDNGKRSRFASIENTMEENNYFKISWEKSGNKESFGAIRLTAKLYDPDKYKTYDATNFALNLARDPKMKNILRNCAKLYIGVVKKNINNGVPPPNAEETIKKKGFDKPFYFSGKMYNNLQCSVYHNGNIIYKTF